VEEIIESVAECGPRDDLAKETISIFHITNGAARKVWQGTPEDARAGRGYVTEEPAPEVPPCKYPVGTIIRFTDWDRCREATTITAARLSWVYSYEHPVRSGKAESDELELDTYAVVVPPDPYPVGSEHVVDLGLLGKQTAKVVRREGDVVTFAARGCHDVATVAEFEKAVVK
jgi:hypothetical protein